MMLETLQILTTRVSHRLNYTNCLMMQSIEIGKINMMDYRSLIYHSLDSILDVFKKPENNDANSVNQLLQIFDRVKEENGKHDSLGDVKSYPLIVLEGLDGSGKTTVGRRVAKKLDAMKWSTPPESIGHLRSLFDDNKELRTAYYSLGNYIAALEVQVILKSKPVVMDRYWHSTAAYAMAQAVQDYPEKIVMPPNGHDIYSWPEDLMKPDIVLLLTVSEEVRLQRQSRRKVVTEQENLLKSCSDFRQNVLEAYTNMRNPGVELINSDYSFGSVLRQIDDKIKHLW